MSKVFKAQFGERPIHFDAFGAKEVNEALLFFAQSKADETLILETDKNKCFRLVRVNGELHIAEVTNATQAAKEEEKCA